MTIANLNNRIKLPLIFTALLALLAAMWAGLVRLGWGWPPLSPSLPIAHGPLMVSGFLGTVIGLERAIAINRRWTYIGPVFTALGSLLLLVGVTGPGLILLALGSIGLLAVFGFILRTHPAIYTLTMAVGALTWFVGNGLLALGWPIFSVVGWWSGFLLLTIAGERLELSRVLRLPQWVHYLFAAVSLIYLVGLVVSLVNLDAGVRLAGVGMVLLALWLLVFDIARHTVRKTGLTRFIAMCLLTGYVWLIVSGALAIIFGGTVAGPHYDAILHTLFVGFVMSMIFGHAPIIFPAVMNKPLPFSRWFYSHLILLHISLALRVVGDVGGLLVWRQWGGLLNVIAILLFLVNTIVAVRRAGPQG